MLWPAVVLLSLAGIAIWIANSLGLQRAMAFLMSGIVVFAFAAAFPDFFDPLRALLPWR